MHYLGRPQPCPQTLGWAGKAYQEKLSSLLRKSVNYGRIIYNIGPWAQRYKNLCHKLRMFQ
jgi:hypothetical protein